MLAAARRRRRQARAGRRRRRPEAMLYLRRCVRACARECLVCRGCHRKERSGCRVGGGGGGGGRLLSWTSEGARGAAMRYTPRCLPALARILTAAALTAPMQG